MVVTILLGIVGLGLMVFVHELGHFVAAKMNGVGVEVFSLGWGPRLAGFRRGGTWYQVSWFPIGGYCKLKGELVPGLAGGGANAAPEAQPAGTDTRAQTIIAPAMIVPVQPRDSFLAAAPWRRVLISLFGPLFNFLFALLAFAIIWGAWFRIFSTDNRIILASDYTLDKFAGTLPAVAAGLHTGDRIVAIDGAPVEKFQDILEAVTVAPGQPLAFTVERGAAAALTTVTLHVTPELDKNTGAGRIGIYAWEDPVIGTVAQGSAASIAGLRPADRIVAVGGSPIANTIDVSQALVSRPKQIPFTFDRGGVRDTVLVVLSYDESGTPWDPPPVRR